jgi:hypothetical protein
MILWSLRRAVASRVVPALLVLALPVAASAQQEIAPARGNSVLTGQVVDSAGKPIVGATVRVPRLERSAITDSTGKYRIEGLPTGRVTLVGEAPGFAGKRADVVVPANGTVEQAFALAPNAHVLALVEVRARSRQQLPLKLHEFDQRRHSSRAGRFLGPDEIAKFNGRPLEDALKSIMVGVRFQRTPQGEMNIVSQRSLNPASIRQSANNKPCGIQIWEDGAQLSDPNQSVELIHEDQRGARPVYPTTRIGADHSYDISNLITNNYMAVEYYSDLASTPPGFRTGTPSCGTLVLWTRVPMPGETGTQVGQQSGAQDAQPQ